MPFWAWFHIAKKISEGDFSHTDKKGLPDLKKPPYRFGQRLTLPANYWDGGPWAMPLEKVSWDDPGGPRSRLFVFLQNEGLKRFYALNRFFPRGTGLNWRYEILRGLYGLSAEDGRLVVSIEDGKEYSEAALWKARQRERELVGTALFRISAPGARAIRTMFPRAKVIRVPEVFEGFWPPEVVRFLEILGLQGKTMWIPRPKKDVRILGASSPSEAAD